MRRWGGACSADDADPRTVAGISRSYLPGSFIYGGSTLIALASPTAAVALFYALESSLFGRRAGV
jgi:hypothetical protein